MKKLALSLALIAATALFAPSVQAEHYKLFVLTGQSNSLGTTNGGESDPTSGSDPADQHIKFAWHNVIGAGSSLGDSAGVFTTLQDQQGGYYSNSATHWGPEVGFSRTLYLAGVRNFGVIKASRGGGGNTHWHKASAGHMYSHVVDTVTTTTTSLTNAGHTFEIVGLLYLQGESDSSSEAAIAGSRLKELVDNLRSDLPNASSMHAISGGIAASGTKRDTVRANHAAIASSTGYIDYFSNLDQASNTASDNLHFNKKAKLTIGQRFAQHFFSAGVVNRHYGKLVFIGDSITQGGNGDHPSYRYQVFKNLADAAVPINPSAGYTFVGSVDGPYANSTITAPDVNGQTFQNNHDGHFGWRSFWINGRTALPANRRSNNRGEGTLLNWTNQASPQEYDIDSLGNSVSYPDPSASGSGNTGTTYTPDTAVIMIGINDIGSGSSATDVRDDIATIIDQLQAANSDVSVFVSQVLHTNQSHNATVDELNALLPALASSKSNASSSVWVIETNLGFDPVTQTYDNVHPNNDGETYVGNRISGGLGIIEMPEPATQVVLPPHIEASSETFTYRFDGNHIWNGSNYINGWFDVGSPTKSQPSASEFNFVNPGSGGCWIEGTNSGWTSSNNESWTFETRIKFNANPNGFILWFGTGDNKIFIQIYGDRTQDAGANSFNVAHNNLDGAYHTWRVAHDKNTGYHVWRDGVRLTAPSGANFDDTGSGENRLILGDSTSGSFGNNYNATIEYLRYELGHSYLPTGADADNDSIPDSWEYSYYGDVVGADANVDDDLDGASNLEEYLANTDPTNTSSRFSVEEISDGDDDSWRIVVPDTSPQRFYTLLQSSDLGITEAWTAVPGQGPIIGTDGDLIFTPTSSDSRHFYTIEVTLP